MGCCFSDVYPFHAEKPREATAPTYNGYHVVRNEDGTYSVANSTDYGTEFDTSRTMYYTQRNRAVLSSSRPKRRTATSAIGQTLNILVSPALRLVSVLTILRLPRTMTAALIWLDNADYNADISTSYPAAQS